MHSCLQGTPSSATMMTSVTTNASSLQRMHSIGAINNSATDSAATATSTTPSANSNNNNNNSNFHLTNCHPTSGAGSDLLITRDENGASKSTGISVGGCGLLSPAMPRKSAVTMNGSKSNQHLSAATSTGGLVGNQRQQQQQQQFIRWTTPPSTGASNCGNSGSDDIRRSLS